MCWAKFSHSDGASTPPWRTHPATRQDDAWVAIAKLKLQDLTTKNLAATVAPRIACNRTALWQSAHCTTFTSEHIGFWRSMIVHMPCLRKVEHGAKKRSGSEESSSTEECTEEHVLSLCFFFDAVYLSPLPLPVRLQELLQCTLCVPCSPNILYLATWNDVSMSMLARYIVGLLSLPCQMPRRCPGRSSSSSTHQRKTHALPETFKELKTRSSLLVSLAILVHVSHHSPLDTLATHSWWEKAQTLQKTQHTARAYENHPSICNSSEQNTVFCADKNCPTATRTRSGRNLDVKFGRVFGFAFSLLKLLTLLCIVLRLCVVVVVLDTN